MFTRTTALIAAALAAVLLIHLGRSAAQQQDPAAPQPARQQEPATPQPPAQQPPRPEPKPDAGPPEREESKGLAALLDGLKHSKGCLGVETARTASGKQVIFAWFEGKQALLAWFYSDAHFQMMQRVVSQRSGRPPLEEVPDDVGPLMVVASITRAERRPGEQRGMPFSQIAVELYRPVRGGLSMGGRFAPDALKVEGLQVYAPPAQREAPEDEQDP